ncbi:hypothetical protein ACLQ2O_09470 [Kribbella sp. DT2]
MSARRIPGIGVDWQIAWSDGPAVATLRARAEDLGGAAIDHPERGEAADLELAARLIRFTGDDETAMLEFLLSYGLTGLRQDHRGADVIELRPHRPASHGPEVEVS